jgi:hypothetical protein
MTRILQTKVETGARLVAKDITNLTFFPVGSILLFSYAAWQSADAEFKTQWHICDGTGGTVNLVDRFPRGTNSTTGQTGGTDVAQLPKHDHTFTGKQATGSLDRTASVAGIPIGAANGVFSGSGIYPTTGIARGNTTANAAQNIKFAMTPEGSVNETGSGSADNRPAFTSVIFIQKVA